MATLPAVPDQPRLSGFPSLAAGAGRAAAAGGALAAIRSVAGWLLGGRPKPAGEALRDAALAGMSGATRGGGQIVVERGITAGVARAFPKMSASVLKRSNCVAALAASAVEQAVDTGRLIAGRIDAAEYGRRTAENAAGTVGGLGGAAAGAAIGTVLFPGAGTVAGGLIGGAAALAGSLGLRGLVGRLLGRKRE